MNFSFWGAIILQGLIVVWLLKSLHICKDASCFLNNECVRALKGYFSIIILLFHVPVSSVWLNCLWGASAFSIVTLFSFFSAYGLTVRSNADRSYIKGIPFRILRLVILYGIVLFMKFVLTENMFSGGILWFNCLLLSYIVFFLAYSFGGGVWRIYRGCILGVICSPYAYLSQ